MNFARPAARRPPACRRARRTPIPAPAPPWCRPRRCACPRRGPRVSAAAASPAPGMTPRPCGGPRDRGALIGRNVPGPTWSTIRALRDAGRGQRSSSSAWRSGARRSVPAIAPSDAREHGLVALAVLGLDARGGCRAAAPAPLPRRSVRSRSPRDHPHRCARRPRPSPVTSSASAPPGVSSRSPARTRLAGRRQHAPRSRDRRAAGAGPHEQQLDPSAGRGARHLEPGRAHARLVERQHVAGLEPRGRGSRDARVVERAARALDHQQPRVLAPRGGMLRDQLRRRLVVEMPRAAWQRSWRGTRPRGPTPLGSGSSGWPAASRAPRLQPPRGRAAGSAQVVVGERRRSRGRARCA